MNITLQASRELSVYRGVEVTSVNDIIKAFDDFCVEAGFSDELFHGCDGGIVERVMSEHVDFFIFAGDNRECFEGIDDFIERGYINGSVAYITLCMDSSVEFYSEVEVECPRDVFERVDSFRDDTFMRETRYTPHGAVKYQTYDLIDGVSIADNNFNFFNNPTDFIDCAFDK